MFFEFRQYTLFPGKRAEWVKYMESVIIPFQVSKGMVILGSFVDDEDESVAVAALEALAESDDVNPFIVEDLASASERRLRAAALEVLALHDETDPAKWVWAAASSSTRFSAIHPSSQDRLSSASRFSG